MHIKHLDGSFEKVPYFSLPSNELNEVIAPSCYSCFDYTNGLADMVGPVSSLHRLHPSAVAQSSPVLFDTPPSCRCALKIKYRQRLCFADAARGVRAWNLTVLLLASLRLSV